MSHLTACLPLNCRAAVEAAIRLRKRLPVREHKIGDDSASTGRPPGQMNAVVIDGRVFRSMRDASREHKVSLAAIYKWLRDGRADYA